MDESYAYGTDEDEQTGCKSPVMKAEHSTADMLMLMETYDRKVAVHTGDNYGTVSHEVAKEKWVASIDSVRRNAERTNRKSLHEMADKGEMIAEQVF